jgi:hypothetical protein
LDASGTVKSQEGGSRRRCAIGAPAGLLPLLPASILRDRGTSNRRVFEGRVCDNIVQHHSLSILQALMLRISYTTPCLLGLCPYGVTVAGAQRNATGEDWWILPGILLQAHAKSQKCRYSTDPKRVNSASQCSTSMVECTHMVWARFDHCPVIAIFHGDGDRIPSLMLDFIRRCSPTSRNLINRCRCVRLVLLSHLAFADAYTALQSTILS